MEYLERHIVTLDWITILIMASLVLMAFCKYLYAKRFEEFFLLPITNKYFLVQGRNESIEHPFNILMFAVQVISVSLFFWLFFKVLYPEETNQNPWLFVQICTGYSVFVLIKFSIEKIIGSVFSIDSLINRYLYQKLSYRNLIGALLLMLNIILFYTISPSALLLGIIAAIILVFNVIALFSSFKNNGNLIMGNLYYFILYLCALEISPYIILYKTLV